jgi:hypothetical protein
MSGIKRQILAECAASGDTGESVMKQFTPDAILSESARSIYAPDVPAYKGDDKQAYIGKMAKPEHPK